MSGIAQGIPQRLTAFVDIKTGALTPPWYRFFYSLWERTGGAPATSTIEDVISWQNMDDTAVPTPPEEAALLAFLMADTMEPTPPEDAAMLAAAMADTATEPENDPALVALMVAD
jgi:hypothetical protein